MITSGITITTGRDSQGFAIMDVAGPQWVDATYALASLNAALSRVRQAISEGQNRVNIEMEMRVLFQHPEHIRELSESLAQEFQDVYDEEEEGRGAYAMERAIARAEAMQDDILTGDAQSRDPYMPHGPYSR